MFNCVGGRERTNHPHSFSTWTTRFFLANNTHTHNCPSFNKHHKLNHFLTIHSWWVNLLTRTTCSTFTLIIYFSLLRANCHLKLYLRLLPFTNWTLLRVINWNFTPQLILRTCTSLHFTKLFKVNIDISPEDISDEKYPDERIITTATFPLRVIESQRAKLTFCLSVKQFVNCFTRGEEGKEKNQRAKSKL